MWSDIAPKEGASLPDFASLLIASALKVASLNLCADEYLLLLAKPQEIASVTRLAQDPLESRLAVKARAFPANRGSLDSVVGTRPNLILTMGGSGRSTTLIAKHLGIRTIDLPQPANLAGVEANLRKVASALGDPRRADHWIARIARLKATAPPVQDTIMVSGGGFSVSRGTAAAEWMRLAGFGQRPLQGGRATLETLLIRPPAVLLRSDYRSGQMSAGQRWFDHPIVRRLKSRTVLTDGRPWTCGGPLMIAEIERLRRRK
jgi:iron complex transport system substrate-binding protein